MQNLSKTADFSNLSKFDKYENLSVFKGIEKDYLSCERKVNI